MALKTKPSAKIKRRYLLLEAKSKKEVEQVILDYIGILGWAKASPYFISKCQEPSDSSSGRARVLDHTQDAHLRTESPEGPQSISVSKKIILAIERKSLTNVRAAFELSIKKIKVLKVSGTLKGLTK